MDGSFSNDNASITSFVRCGQIHFGGSHFRLPCIVKALSEDAARLHVFGAHRLPDRFWLSVEMMELEAECEVVTRDEKIVTVRFCGAAAQPGNGRPNPKVLEQPERAATTQAAPPRLWVVEDDPDDCALLSDAFRQQKLLCDLKFFSDGAQFLDFLRSSDQLIELSSPALTLLDLNMPRMDGLATLSVLRSDMRFRHLPVVVFTTSNSEHDIQKTYMLGVTAYITKPSRQDDLNRIVDFITSYWTAGVRFPAKGPAALEDAAQPAG